jgi:hypothetical protein
MSLHGNRIRVRTENHGEYECSGATFDRMIARYLPASPLDMQRVLYQNVSPYFTWGDIQDVSTALVILGDHHAHEFGDRGA